MGTRKRSLVTLALAGLLAACGDQAEPDYGALQVALTATAHTEVSAFRVTIVDWLTQDVLLDVTVPSTFDEDGRAVATTTRNWLAPRLHLVAGEARNAANEILARREALVMVVGGQTTSVELVLDIASMEGPGHLTVDLATNNGAHFARSELSNPEPGPNEWQSITIVEPDDFDLDPVETGFVVGSAALAGSPLHVFFAGDETSLDFQFPDTPGSFEVFAAAIDTYRMGTAHFFEFNTQSRTSKVNVYRVHDVHDLDGDGFNDILIASQEPSSVGPAYVRVWIDTTGDGVADERLAFMNHSAVTWQTFPGDDLRYWVRVENLITPAVQRIEIEGRESPYTVTVRDE
jgi:hypothetical protein